MGAVTADDTCRLLPGPYAEEPEHVLGDLADDADHTAVLVRLAAVTNARLLAQEGRNVRGVDRADLVFNTPESRIVNAAFSYPGNGARFHSSDSLGAWYCARDVDTARDEVMHHRVRHLRETDVPDEADIPYRLLLADIRAENFALLTDQHPSTNACLDPHSYTAGQRLGDQLRARNASGVEYHSVRHRGGICLAVLRAPIVGHVRRSDTFYMTIRGYTLVSFHH